MSNRKAGQTRFELGGLLAAAGARLAALRKALSRGKNRRVGSRRVARAALPDVAGQARAALHKNAPAGALRGLWDATRTFVSWALPVVVAVLAFATPLLGVRAYHYVMTSGHFAVREVLVEGNRRLGYDAIRKTLGVEPGTQLLAADIDVMQERCQAHPWVSWCKVERELPDRLVVELVEHEPAAYVALGDLWLVDTAGAVFAAADAKQSLDLPIITGVSADALADPARRAETESRLRGALNTLSLYRTMGLAGRWPVGEVRLDAVRGLTLVISPMGTEAVLGHGPYRDKLFRLEWVLESLHQQGKTAEYVVLDMYGTGTNAGRVVVKADLPPAGEALLDQATERAHEAERKVLGLPPDPDIFGPAIAPSLLAPDAASGPDGVGGDDEAPVPPTLTGGRPAVEPSDLNIDDGEGE